MISEIIKQVKDALKMKPVDVLNVIKVIKEAKLAFLLEGITDPNKLERIEEAIEGLEGLINTYWNENYQVSNNHQEDLLTTLSVADVMGAFRERDDQYAALDNKIESLEGFIHFDVGSDLNELNKSNVGHWKEVESQIMDINIALQSIVDTEKKRITDITIELKTIPEMTETEAAKINELENSMEQSMVDFNNEITKELHTVKGVAERILGPKQQSEREKFSENFSQFFKVLKDGINSIRQWFLSKCWALKNTFTPANKDTQTTKKTEQELAQKTIYHVDEIEYKRIKKTIIDDIKSGNESNLVEQVKVLRGYTNDSDQKKTECDRLEQFCEDLNNTDIMNNVIESLSAQYNNAIDEMHTKKKRILSLRTGVHKGVDHAANVIFTKDYRNFKKAFSALKKRNQDSYFQSIIKVDSLEDILRRYAKEMKIDISSYENEISKMRVSVSTDKNTQNLLSRLKCFCEVLETIESLKENKTDTDFDEFKDTNILNQLKVDAPKLYQAYTTLGLEVGLKAGLTEDVHRKASETIIKKHSEGMISGEDAASLGNTITEFKERYNCANEQEKTIVNNELKDLAHTPCQDNEEDNISDTIDDDQLGEFFDAPSLREEGPKLSDSVTKKIKKASEKNKKNINEDDPHKDDTEKKGP